MLPMLVLTAGIGLPELLHAEVGTYVVPRVDLHVRAGFPLLQPAVGVGARGHFGPAEADLAPRWAFTTAFDVSINPVDRQFYEHGETMGFAMWPMVGGELLTDSGFVARIEAGAVLGFEDRSGDVRLGGGPNVRVSLGKAWGR